MAREIRIPELGENVEEAEVLSVLVSEGDEVKADQPVLELETDKATFEMPCPEAGVVKAIRVSEGDRVEVGAVVLELEAAEAAADEDRPAEADEEEGAPEEAREEGAEPRRREAKTEAGGGKQDRKEAAAEKRRRKKRDEKAERDPEAVLEKAEKAEEEEEGERQGRKQREAGAKEVPRPSEREPEPGPSAPSGEAPAPAAPSVRRLARELGFSVDDVGGTGPAGRISVEDVKHHARGLIRGRMAAPRRERRHAAPALPDFSEFGEVTREPLSGIRRRTAENMTRSWMQIPHVAQHDRADVTELERARRRHAGRAEAAGARLTLTAIVVKVAAAALGVFPKFNASLDVDRDEAVLKRYVNIGVAVDTEHGLLAPVIREADRKSLVEIAADLSALSERARERKARPDDLAGSCFTVTNLGGLGTTTFAPLVNWPEVAVLGVGRADEVVRMRDGEPQARLVLPLSISYDHRWIDGADAARFLRWVAEALEDPLLLSLGA